MYTPQLVRRSQPEPSFDPSKAKEVTVILIKNSVVPRNQQPLCRLFRFRQIWFDGPSLVTREALLQKSDREFLRFLMFKAAARVARLASPRPVIEGLALDRDAFGNLVSVGSMGFLLGLLPEIVDGAG